MKRFVIAFAAVITVGFVTGCGSKKNEVVCTGKITEGGVTQEAKIVAKLKKNKVSDGYMEIKYSDQKSADTMCSMMKLANSMAEKDSEKIDYTCKGKTMKINSLKTFDEEGNLIGLTKEEFIKQATSENDEIKCK